MQPSVLCELSVTNRATAGPLGKIGRVEAEALPANFEQAWICAVCGMCLRLCVGYSDVLFVL